MTGTAVNRPVLCRRVPGSNGRMKRDEAMRCFIVIGGVTLVGIAVAMMKLAAFGLDPYTAMNSGLGAMSGMSFGSVQLAVNAAVLVAVFVLQRNFIGFGTIFNMIFVGYVADFAGSMLAHCGVSFTGTVARMAAMLAGVIVICFGTALYISADLGMSPYDASGYILERLVSRKVSFRIIRIVTDALCVCIAFFSASRTGMQWDYINLGTIVMTFGTGPLIQLFREHVTDEMVEMIRGGEGTHCQR